MGKRKRGDAHCFAWGRDGECKYGDECKFSHDPAQRGRLRQEETANAPAATQANCCVPLRGPAGQEGARFASGVPRPRLLDERGFRKAFKRDADHPGEDLQVLEHPNGVRLLALAPGHPALCREGGLSVRSVRYAEVSGVRLDQVEVVGKKKSGSVKVQAGQPLCEVERSDGVCYTVRAALQGRVVETNERLLQEPELLRSHEGFVAIMLPSFRNQGVCALETEEEYQKPLAAPSVAAVPQDNDEEVVKPAAPTTAASAGVAPDAPLSA